MNKSKFLKKSLAMLLALMLVLAMIPLSASAANGPAITEVTVDGVVAAPTAGDDTSYEVSIPEPSDAVEVSVDVRSDAGTVAHYTNGISLDSNNAEQEGGLWVFELTEQEMAAKKFTFDVLVNNAVVETYTVSYETVAPSDDASLKSVYLDGQYDVWNNIDTNKEINYTVVAPYDLDFTDGKDHYVVVTPNNANATVTPGTSNGDGTFDVEVSDFDSRVTFRVDAANGNHINYSVTVVRPIPFKSFSIEGERHTSQISRVTEKTDFEAANSDPAVEVYIPYGEKTDGDGNYYFTPTFETNYNVELYLEKVRDDDGNTVFPAEPVKLVSGETYNLNNFTDTALAEDTALTTDVVLDLTVSYSDDATEDWKLAFDFIDADTVAAIKGLTVNNYVAEIDGTTITLTMPASVRKTATQIKVTMSEGETVNMLVDKDTTYTAISDDDDTPKVMNIAEGTLNAKDRYTLRVTAAAAEFDQTKEDVQDYDLVLVTAPEQEPVLKTLTLKNEETGETLEGRIDGHKVYFDGENAIPYRYKNRGALGVDAGEKWQLFWTAPQGTTVTYGGTVEGDNTILPVSGSYVSGYEKYLPVANLPGNVRFNNAEAEWMIVVGNDTKNVGYTIVFTSAPASRVSTLGETWLAKNSVKEYDKLNTQNHVKAVIDGQNISAEIYWKEWEEYNDLDDYNNKDTDANGNAGAAFVTTLPAGAKIYFVNDYSKQLTELTALNEKTDKDATIDYLPAAELNDRAGYKYAKLWDGSKHIDAPTSLEVIVASEALVDKLIGTETLTNIQNNDDYDGTYTVYNLTLTQKAPRTGNNLESLSIYDNRTGKKVTATPNGDKFTITVPYYFTDENRNSHNDLYLDFTPEQGGQTVEAYYTTTNWDEVTPLAYKLDGSLDTSASVQVVYRAEEKDGIPAGWYVKEIGANRIRSLSSLRVSAEDPTSATKTYTVEVKVAEANEEAVLNSVTIAGSTARPDGTDVTVTVPYGTEVTSLAPTFDVSENAYVIEGTEDNIGFTEDALKKIVQPGETYNWLTPRTFTVVAEDGHECETYTITVVVSDQFVDVTPDQWFYDEVMTAAGKGWVNGQGDGKFNPNGTMTRADFALIVARIMGYNEADYPTSAFPDVDSDQYYSAAVAFCKAHNIIDGDDKGNFNPTDPITREQMAKILCQAKQLKVTVPEKTFDDDAKIAEWAKGYVYACQEAGIMEGDNGSFRPTDNATRAEGAAVLVRAFA